MRFPTLLLSVGLLLSCAMAAQTPPPASSPFLLRLMHVSASRDKGATQCIIVYDDGRYERELTGSAFGLPQQTQVARGTLRRAELQKLRSVLSQPSLAKFTAKEELARGKEVETMTAIIPRPEGRQVFTVSRADTDTMSPAAQPLLDWFKALPDVAFSLPPEGVQPNGCRPPAK